MSEYLNVEKPFLDQLAGLGWQVIDQGPAFPVDPTASLRTGFREIVKHALTSQGSLKSGNRLSRVIVRKFV